MRSTTDPWSIGYPGRARTVDGSGISVVTAGLTAIVQVAMHGRHGHKARMSGPPEQDNNWSLIQQLPWRGEIITCWIWDRLITWRGPEALETDQRTERQASSLTGPVGFDRMNLERKHMQTNKQKQYQEALNNTFNPAGYRVSNMTPTNIERRIITAVNIAIGDDGHRAKEILENWQQLMEMDDKTYFKQVKFYG